MRGSALVAAMRAVPARAAAATAACPASAAAGRLARAQEGRIDRHHPRQRIGARRHEAADLGKAAQEGGENVRAEHRDAERREADGAETRDDQRQPAPPEDEHHREHHGQMRLDGERRDGGAGRQWAPAQQRQRGRAGKPAGQQPVLPRLEVETDTGGEREPDRPGRGSGQPARDGEEQRQGRGGRRWPARARSAGPRRGRATARTAAGRTRESPPRCRSAPARAASASRSGRPRRGGRSRRARQRGGKR